MTGAVKRRTNNFGFNIINYDFPRWHTYDWQNWDVVDAVLAAANLTSVRGIWENATDYISGDRVVDGSDSTLWLCSIAHTSASTGTFLEDRTANPTYWTAVSNIPIWRGDWLTATNYVTQDVVRTSNAFYFCISTHTSGVFADDLAAGRWTLIIDLSDAIDAETNAVASASAAATSATNAGNSATAAAGSASNAATSATNASNSASAASGSATIASNAATTATIQAGNASTSATNAGNSASAAAGSASAASTSATNAATSATNANNSAIAAAASVASIAGDIVQIGTIEFYPFKVPPTKRLKLDGSAISIAAYTALDAVLYCGNADNATADWGYRCTNPANPNGSRSTSGTHIVLPDLRGEFIRIFDDGRGVDTARSMWATQADAFKSHTHNSIASGASIINSGAGNLAAGAAVGGDTGSSVTGNAGGTETRPRNLALMACIKYA